MYLFIICAVFFPMRSAQADGKDRRLLRALFGVDPSTVGGYGLRVPVAEALVRAVALPVYWNTPDEFETHRFTQI